MRKDWQEAQERQAFSFGTWKKPWINQRCAEQLWEKLDRGEKVRPTDLAACSECVRTLKRLRGQGYVRLTLEGFLKPPLAK